MRGFNTEFNRIELNQFYFSKKIPLYPQVNELFLRNIGTVINEANERFFIKK